MNSIDQEIAEYATSALLRYFRRGSPVGVVQPRIDVERDREILRSHWAISSPVRSLLSYLLLHRHETQAMLITRERIDDVVARGRIDARRTVIHRLRSGAATSMVAHEPVRTFESGPNQVLAWVIHNASRLASRLQALQAPNSGYAVLAASVVDQMNQVRRLDALREPLRSPAVQKRPSPGTLRDAARARRHVYRLAVDAYNTLVGVDAGDETAIRNVITSTLVAPLEPWRRLEIAVAIAIGEALSVTLKKPFHLATLAGETSQPILTCDFLSLYWQQATSLYSAPPQEPSEAKVSGILSAYGLGFGADRPDLLLINTATQKVAAVVEVKYLAADTATARFREAVEQIVRYSRGYASGVDLDDLIGRSLVAMSVQSPQTLTPKPASVPAATDFSQIVEGSLQQWAVQFL